MMTLDPKKRLSIDQVIKHKWLCDSTMRTTVLDLFRVSGDNQNYAPFLENQMKNMRLSERRPITHAPTFTQVAKRPRYDFSDPRL